MPSVIAAAVSIAASAAIKAVVGSLVVQAVLSVAVSNTGGRIVDGRREQ